MTDDACLLPAPTCTARRSVSDIRPDCLMNYLSIWENLAAKRPNLRGVTRDMAECAKRYVSHSQNHNDDEPSFTCKRPGCQICGPLKHSDTAIRLESLIEADQNGRMSGIGGHFSIRTVSADQLGLVVDQAINTWSRVIRTKKFRHRVSKWGRTVEVTPAKGQELNVVVHVTLRLTAPTRPDRESAFYCIAGLLSDSGWRPINVIHLDHNDIADDLATFARSGFDPRNFCCDGKTGLKAEPRFLLPLHEGLHGRRLVYFGSTTR